MNITEIKKALYKQQPKAKFIRIENSVAYYGSFVELEDSGINENVMFAIPVEDMGDTKFWREEEAKLLIRWILGYGVEKIAGKESKTECLKQKKNEPNANKA